MLCYFLLVTMVSDEKSAVIWIGIPLIGNVSSLYSYFQGISIPFTRKYLITMCHIYPFGVHSATLICRILSFAKFEKFSAIILILFQFYLLPLQRWKWYNVGPFIIAQSLLRSCQSFSVYLCESLFSLCSLVWINFIGLKFTNSIPPLFSLCYWVHSMRFFFYYYSFQFFIFVTSIS